MTASPCSMHNAEIQQQQNDSCHIVWCDVGVSLTWSDAPGMFLSAQPRPVVVGSEANTDRTYDNTF